MSYLAQNKTARNFTRIFGRLLSFMFLTSAAAMPPHPGLLNNNSDSREPNGCRTAASSIPAQPGLNAPSELFSLQKANIDGTFRALAVLIEFSDKSGSVDAFKFDSLLFENRPGSVRDYYQEMSYSRLDITTINLPSSTGWVAAPQAYSYYCGGRQGVGGYPTNTQKLCEDIVDLIDPVVDFSEYDNNKNGYADAIILIHSGQGAEIYGRDSVDLIWSHKWNISPRKKDGVFIYEYTVQPEYWFQPGDMTCGVFCHELGHIFGLPDLYDRDESSYGIGNWSVMSYGSWLGPSHLGGCPAGLDAWSRIQLGFNTHINITTDTKDVSIAGITDGGPIYRLWSNGNPGCEYFLIENRRQTGYDTYLPGEGLLIWHIDETKAGAFNSINDNEHYPGNSSEGNYLVALEQADGLFQMEKRLSRGNAGDPYPGSSGAAEFSSTTTPDSKAYDDDITYVAVNDISSSGTVITADIIVSLPGETESPTTPAIPLSFDLGQNYPNPFNAETSIEINLSRSSLINLDIIDILGREVRTLAEENLPSGNSVIHWDGRDNLGEQVSSGVYFYRLTTECGKETKKMILLK